MAKQLIPEELQTLIDQYLTDGVLTDKERQVILRKAEGMGLDRDEIDLYLDAEVQKIDQATDAATRRQKGKQCPYCGGSIPQLADKCPHCGENVTAEASSELQEIFDNLEDALVNLKSGKDIHASKATVERFARKAKMYYGNNPKIQKLLEEIEIETANAEKKAKSIVRKNFLLENKKWIIATAVLLVALISFGIYKYTEETGKNVTEKVTKLTNAGDLATASDYLISIEIPKSVKEHGTSAIVEEYDAAFLKVIKAYIKDDNYDSAEELAISWRAKIGNELSWAQAPTYLYLRSLYEKEGRDFSALLSSDDFISR